MKFSLRSERTWIQAETECEQGSANINGKTNRGDSLVNTKLFSSANQPPSILVREYIPSRHDFNEAARAEKT